MLSLLLSFEERERTRERKCQQRLGKRDRRHRIATRRKSKTTTTTADDKERRRRVDDDNDTKNARFLTWRTPAPDDLQKRRLVILGQVRFRALQPHSQRGQFRLEDAENVLHVRSGKIARVDRDVFAAVADWDLDQSNNCIFTVLSLLLLLSRHDDREESFLSIARSKDNKSTDERKVTRETFSRE